MLNKKVSTLVGIIIIVAVAVILFSGVFGYQYYLTKTNAQPFVASAPQGEPAGSNSNTETAGPALSEVEGWKTYNNNDLGFQFSYPKSWYIIEPNGNANTNPTVWFKMGVYTGCAGDVPCGNFNIDITDVSALEGQKFPTVNLISSGQKDFIVADMSAKLQNIIQQKRKVNVFGNGDGYETIVKFCYGDGCKATIGPMSIVDVLVFGKIYHIEYTEGVKNGINEWQFYNEFNQVLSTFKFTK
ncbi:MAG: hypothetical protein AAB352_00060 [Patescibacteria group bacterium]